MHCSRPLLESTCTEITSRKHFNGSTCRVQRYAGTENLGLVGNMYIQLDEIISAVHRPINLLGKVASEVDLVNGIK
jgi:hypothetical protein